MTLTRRLTASALALVLVTALTACGGGGGGSEDPGRSNLFVADSYSSIIGAFSNAHPAPGQAIQGVGIASHTATLNSVTAMELDSGKDILYLANGSSLLAVDKAGSARNYVSMRTVGYFSSSSMFLDRTNHRLYVEGNSQINVYDGLDTKSSGVTPTRQITLTSMFPVRDIAVDAANNVLYAYGYDTGAGTYVIGVYPGASTMNGNVSPTRRITLGASVGNHDSIVLDEANDVLYVSALCNVYSVTTAHTATGAIGPALYSLTGIDGCRMRANIAKRRLYVVTGETLYILENMGATPGVQMSMAGTNLTSVAVRQ